MREQAKTTLYRLEEIWTGNYRVSEWVVKQALKEKTKT